MHPQNKMLGSDPFCFHFIFILFYFKRGYCPLILFRCPLTMHTHARRHVAEHHARGNPFAPGTIAAAPAAHTRGTFHRRLQPLYTEKRKVSCSGFLPNTNPMQQSCSRCSHHLPKSPLPFITTSLSHHFPKSPCSLRHHFPSSPLPFVTTSLRHHPSS